MLKKYPAAGANYTGQPQLHKHICVKANVAVDTGVAPLVNALSDFPLLRTIESCQDVDGKGTAWVCFDYGEGREPGWCPLAEFVLGYLAPELMREFGDFVSIKIEATNFTIGHLSVRAGSLPSVVKALQRLHRKYNQRAAP